MIGLDHIATKFQLKFKKKTFFHIYIICKIIIIRKGITDDTSFSYSSRDELQIKTVIDHDLKELDEWSITFNGRTIPITNSNKLDQLQLEAARIVTGLPIFASSILIYKELTSTLFPFDVSSVRMSIYTVSL